MKRLLLRCNLVLLLIGSLCLPLAAETPSAPSPTSWIDTYYKAPQPERFVEEVRVLSQKGILSKPNAHAPILGFLSQVLAQNPQRIAAWMTALDNLPDADKKILQEAVWYSFRPEGIGFLESKGLQEYHAKLPPDILTLEINAPEILDMLWGYFLATGKEAPVRRIISAFNLAPYAGSLEKYKTSQKTEQDKKAAYLDVTLQSAVWSLRSNCQQHPRVREICETLLQGNTLNGLEVRGLTALLGKDQPQKDKALWYENGKPIGDKPNMKARNGFGAQLFLTEDSTFFENWNKPETPNITPAAKARRNIPVHTVLLFTNPGLDAAEAADVTADITVLKPDGSTYATLPAVVCWKDKYTTPAGNLQLARGHMAIRIETQDPVGHYTVKVLVHDNNKKVALPLETGFDVPE